MKCYKFVEFEDHDENEKNEDTIIKGLKDILEQCIFITTRYGIMYHVNTVYGIQDSHRGPILRFVDGTTTYYYNITGGYMEYEDNYIV